MPKHLPQLALQSLLWYNLGNKLVPGNNFYCRQYKSDKFWKYNTNPNNKCWIQYRDVIKRLILKKKEVTKYE